MKKFIYNLLNNIMVAFVFILATYISHNNWIYGSIAFLIAFICLDYHSYIEKKLNYPNNLFIH